MYVFHHAEVQETVAWEENAYRVRREPWVGMTIPRTRKFSSIHFFALSERLILSC